jgi:hypothetical protein
MMLDIIWSLLGRARDTYSCYRGWQLLRLPSIAGIPGYLVNGKLSCVNHLIRYSLRPSALTIDLVLVVAEDDDWWRSLLQTLQ